MRPGTGFLCALLGLAGPGQAQRFGFTHQMLPARGDVSVAASLGDFDGDGDLDMFVGTWDGPNRLDLNDGAGFFADATATNLPSTVAYSTSVASGDLDGDGDLDLFVGNGGSLPSPENRVYVNAGAGVFADATAASLPFSTEVTRAVALGDLDGDGDVDALAGNDVGPSGTAGQERLYVNGGGGIFTDATASNLPALGDSTRAVALGDVDGDGDLDAFVGNNPEPNRLLLNGGAAVFTDVTAASLPSLLDYTTAVALGDVDGDGDLDAFVGIESLQNHLFLNGGTGVFTEVSATNLPAVLENTQAVALGDVDGDGDLDALVGNYAQQSRLLLNGGTGVFADVTATSLPAVSGRALAVALGDVDGDGDLDAFVGNELEPDDLYLNDGAGLFIDVTFTSLPTLLDWTLAIALGDVDGDGDLDAFAGNSDSGTGAQSRLFRNDGTGAFADATAGNLPAILDATRSVALGDVDGDGDLDAFVGNGGNPAGPEQSRLYRNGGTGAFADDTAASLPSQVATTAAVSLGDVDGDGDLDAFLGNLPQQDRLYRNGGTGVFIDVTAASLPSLLDSTRAVALGDADGDGDLDALIGNYFQQNRLYLNGGTGIFADASAANLPVAQDLTTAVALGDVDGDGDLDALLGNAGLASGQQCRLYVNSGLGAFTDVTAAGLPATSFVNTQAVALGDVDGDGDLDAFLGNQTQDRLYLNGGTGVFVDVTATDLPVLPADAYAVALGDLDGDGDLDVYIGNRDQDRVCANLTRQLAWRGIPRVGKPLVLDLWGTPNGTWLLGASLSSASIAVPPFGTLRLSPSTLWIVAGGALDPQGRASVSLVVPANPALVGFSVYWQAVVGPPLRLTNLEVTTPTSL